MAKVNEVQNHIEVHDGPREDMLKSRGDNLKKFQAILDKVTKDYKGGAIAVVRIDDVEGEENKCQTSVVITGVASGPETVALGKGLQTALKQIETNLEGSVVNDPMAALMAMLSA